MTAIDTTERPLVFIWEVTQACDLSCDHCRADAHPARHPDELSATEAKKLLAQVRAFGEGQLVVFSGGDPCKRPDLVDLVEYGTDIGLTITMTPSGTSELTADAIGDLKDAGLKRIALSLDGASVASHDSFRGEQGIFEETMRAARAVRDASVPLQINTTVCQRTVGELPAIRNRVRNLDAVLWSVFFLVPVGRGRMLDPVSPEQSEEVMEWLTTVSDEEDFGLKTTEAPHYRRVVAQQRAAETPDDARESEPGSDRGTRRRAGVVAGDGFAFVSHTGDIYPSGFLPQSAGNVRRDDPVERYRNSPLFQRLRNRDALEGKCGECPFRDVCGGSRSRAFAYTGNPMASDPLCPYLPPGYDGPLPAQEFSTGSG